MGLFSFLSGRSGRLVELSGDGSYSFEVVGESHYQRALETICGGRTEQGAKRFCVAHLVFDPKNHFDPNAIAVQIDGHKVAHLSRENAADYHEMTQRLRFHGRPATCPALIVGGWDDGAGDQGQFGVKLDLNWPIQRDG